MKLLVIQQKMIGDVLTSSILFEILREAYPKAQLDYLINTHTYPVVENNPYISNYIFLSPKAEKSRRELYKLAKKVRNTHYDIVIDVYSKLSSNLITLLSGAKTTISYHKYYTSFLYTNNLKRLKSTEKSSGLAIVNRLQLLEPLQITNSSVRPKIYLTKDEIENSKQFLEISGVDFKKPLYMISVLGSGKTKTYPFEFMAEIINQIVEVTSGQVVFNYIPNQFDDAKRIFDLCSESTQKHIKFDVFGKSLREFLAITYHCDALIGNEGGAVNMAKALNIKTFTIFSPWIDKATWSVFEEDGIHESVHLKDFMPELYEHTTEKDKKNSSEELYNSFKPDFFKEKLNLFLQKTFGND